MQNLTQKRPSSKPVLPEINQDSVWVRYFFAFLFTLAAFLLSTTLPDIGTRPSFLFFLVAVLASAIYGGGGAGVAATLMSALAGIFLVARQPLTSAASTQTQWLGMVVFLIVAPLVVWQIEQHRKAQQELRRSEERLRLAFEASNAWYWEWDIVKDRISQSRGPTPEMVDAEHSWYWESATSRSSAGKNEEQDDEFSLEFGANLRMLLEQLHPDDRERMRTAIDACVNDGAELDQVARNLTRDGSVRYVSWKGRAYYDNLGKPVRAVGVAMDVTYRQLAQNDLRVSRKKLEMAQCAARIGTWEWDLRTDALVLVGGDQQHPLGFAPGTHSSSLKIWLNTLVHPGDRARVEWALQHSITQRVDYDTEFRVIAPDGSIHWIASRGQVQEEGGVPVRMLGISMDMTARRDAEESIRRSESKFRSLVENAPYGICRCSPQGDFLDANPAMLQMLGYDSQAQLVEASAGGGVFGDPQQRAQLFTRLEQGQPTAGVELQWKHRAGTPVLVRLNGHAVVDNAGVISHFEMSVENVSERRALEDQLRQSQKMEAVGLLAGGIAHDFNNSLNIIIGYTELIRNQLAPEDPMRNNTGQVLEAADQAALLIQQLLAFGRKQPRTPKVIDLNSLLADLGKTLPRLLGETVELELAPCPEEARVRADQGQLIQVLLNLAINARDAMPKGGKLFIEISRVISTALRPTDENLPPGTYVLLSVRDTGLGIPHEIQPRIFEPFFTTKEAGKGTGLGLATAYGIVKQSDGHIYLHSKPGGGTTFDIYLPETDAAVEAAVVPVPVTASPGKGAETILLVEDAPALRQLLVENLRSKGYGVIAAKNGSEAIEIARTTGEHIDLVLSDIVMPGMNGREMGAHLAAIGLHAPIVFMSGYAEDEISGPPLMPGCAFIQKPFTMDALAREIREMLDQKKSSVRHTA